MDQVTVLLKVITGQSWRRVKTGGAGLRMWNEACATTAIEPAKPRKPKKDWPAIEAFAMHGLTHGDFPMLFLRLPVVVISEANTAQFGNPGAKHARHVDQRETVKLALMPHRSFLADATARTKQPRYLVTLTRLWPGTRRMDADNLGGAWKYVKDSIAGFLGVDDGDTKRVAWVYEQRRVKGNGIEICIEAKR